jgi:hypothetical protein
MRDDEKLMSPEHNDLIPRDNGPEIVPPELSPDYIERPKPGAGIDALEDALRASKADPCGFDDGLQLRRSAGEGLHVFKGDRIVRDLADLEPDELRTIKRYVEGSL